MGWRQSNLAPSPGFGETQAEELLRKYKKEVERGNDIYELFYNRQPDADLFWEVEWPEDQVVLGQATAIGYRSDKWHKGKNVDYIHRHDRPYPRVIMERPWDDQGEQVLADLMGQRTTNKPLSLPKAPVFSQLGYCLDIEYLRDGIVQQLDYKDGELPILAADLTRNILIVCPVGGGYPVLVSGPKIKITSAGIEG